MIDIEYLEYVTDEGDRWDNISYEMYGTVNEIETLIRANLSVGTIPILPAGIVLRIPILNKDALTSTEDLPPWKQ